MDEAGVKGDDIGYWFASYVPAGTPPRGRAVACPARRRHEESGRALVFS